MRVVDLSAPRRRTIVNSEMATKVTMEDVVVDFRQQLVDTVERRHCKRHPLTKAWAAGELDRAVLGAWAREHYHFTRDVWSFYGQMVANCPVREARAMILENLMEEGEEVEDPHIQQLLDFARACGLDSDEVRRAEPLPTTKALKDWIALLASKRTWQEAVAGINIGMESQLPVIIGQIGPALEERYGFAPEEIRFFRVHEVADVKHGGEALDMVAAHTPPELREAVLQAAWEGTEKRWLYFDGVYIQHVLRYRLGDHP